MFYVAYFKKSAAPEARPLTFLFNGGPGSSTVCLHMGAFVPNGRNRGQHPFAAGALYDRRQRSEPARRERSHIRGRARHGFQSNLRQRQGKAFYGVDADAYAFAKFITGFLSKYSSWNSPKFLFGESYGTTRSAALINLLETV
jgi:carboxypeptidase C (cathepsin A)